MTDADAVQLVTLFWDYNMAPLLPNCDVNDLSKNITKSLNSISEINPSGPTYQLGRKFVVGDFTRMDQDTLKSLKRQQFEFTEALERYAYCGEHAHLYRKPNTHAPEFYLENLLVDHVIRQNTTSQPCLYVLVITSDYEFGKSLETLYYGGYTTFLAHMKDAPPELTPFGMYTWYWEEMMVYGCRQMSTNK